MTVRNNMPGGPVETILLIGKNSINAKRIIGGRVVGTGYIDIAKYSSSDLLKRINRLCTVDDETFKLLREGEK